MKARVPRCPLESGPRNTCGFSAKGNSQMASNGYVDYYEVLQVSESAEPETINRVYRIFAQRYHPDNQETGNETRFREITEAYHVLSSPERRAQFDATHQRQRKERWRLVSAGVA